MYLKYFTIEMYEVITSTTAANRNHNVQNAGSTTIYDIGTYYLCNI